MNIQKKLKLIRQEIKNIDKKLINLYEDSFKNNQARIEDLEAKQMLLKDESYFKFKAKFNKENFIKEKNIKPIGFEFEIRRATLYPSEKKRKEEHKIIDYRLTLNNNMELVEFSYVTETIFNNQVIKCTLPKATIDGNT